MPEHATGSRAARGDLASRIDAQLPKRLTPEADLYVDAADGDPPATPDRAAKLACDICETPLPDGSEWFSVGGFLGVCRPCWIWGRIFTYWHQRKGSV